MATVGRRATTDRAERPDRWGRQLQFDYRATGARQDFRELGVRRSGPDDRTAGRDHRKTRQGAERTVKIEPHTQRIARDWSDENFDLDDLVLPAQEEWQRCGAVHCIDRGPWMGTLVCCIRRSGHERDHSMSLGDAGESDFWQEHWL